MLGLAFGPLLLFIANRASSAAYRAINQGASVAEWIAEVAEDLAEHTPIALVMVWLIGAVAQRGPDKGSRRWLALAIALALAAFLGALLRTLEIVAFSQGPMPPMGMRRCYGCATRSSPRC